VIAKESARRLDLVRKGREFVLNERGWKAVEEYFPPCPLPRKAPYSSSHDVLQQIQLAREGEV